MYIYGLYNIDILNIILLLYYNILLTYIIIYQGSSLIHILKKFFCTIKID